MLLLLSSVNAKVIQVDELTKNPKLSIGHQIQVDEIPYSVLKELGSGNTSRVFEISHNGKSFALRVPKHEGNFNTFSKYVDYIDAFKLGHKILEKQNVRVPKIHNYESSKFLLVEQLELKNSFDLEKLFFYEENIDLKVRKQALDSLTDFIKSIAPFSEIRDFNLSQLVFSPFENQWILLDWTHSHSLIDKVDSKQVLTIKMLEDKWNSEIYYRKIKEGTVSKQYSPTDEVRQLFRKLDTLTLNTRSKILEEESLQLDEVSKLQSLYEILEELNKRNYIRSNATNEFIISKIRETKKLNIKDVITKLPSILFSNNNDYTKAIDALIKHAKTLEDLEDILTLRDPLGARIEWKLEQEIQKLITTNNKFVSKETLNQLVSHPFVSNYAKAYIKREFLNIEPKASCNSLIRTFL